MPTSHEKAAPRLFDHKNDKIRIDVIETIKDDHEVMLQSFMRRLGAPHLYHERVLPLAKTGEGTLFVAVSDRQWPPWGLGARSIHALCQLHRIGDHSFGVSPVLASEEDLTNVGLLSAVYKETLEHAAREGDADINYLVIEGSILADRVLRASGFEPSEDFLLNDHARYHVYRAKAQTVLERLGLAQVSTPELLAHRVDDGTFDKNALHQSMLQIAMRPGLLGAMDAWRREMILIDSALSGAALPGGVDVSKRLVFPGNPGVLRGGLPR